MDDSTRPVLLADLTAGLIWPRLLRALPLAAHPSRILLASISFIWLMAVGSAFDLIAGRPIHWPNPDANLGAFQALAISDRQAEAAGLPKPDIFAQAPTHAWSLLATLLILVVPVLLIIHAALARSVACDVSQRLNLSSASALRFAARKWPSILAAWFGPVLLTLFLILILLIAGLLFRVPILDVLAGAFYGLYLLLGAAIVLLTLGFLLAQSLLAPAVVIENTDAIDATQRAYAYLICRPGRFILYTAILLAQAVISVLVATFLIVVVLQWTGALAGHWSLGPILSRPEPSGTTAIAAALARIWQSLCFALLAGFVLSFYSAASTLLYLALRRINDDQDMEDIWLPDPRRAAE